MELIRDFGKWMIAVVRAWYGWVGASATVGLVGFGQGMGWWESPGKRVYISLLVVGFVSSMFQAWRPEWLEAKRVRESIENRVEVRNSTYGL